MYLARQPIVDVHRRIAGYELLFRTGGEAIADGGRATASVAASAFADPAFADLLGRHRGFINVDTAFLESDLVEFLPPQRIVLEILETTCFTPAVVARCGELKAKGYRLASDDYRGDHAAIAPALALLDIVKVDLPFLGGRDPGAIARSLPGMAMLAEKVETEAQFLQCRDAGYVLCQGYHFARPAVLGRTGGDTSRAAALAPLSVLEQDGEDPEVEDAIKRHPALVVGLLRQVNAAATGLAKPIDSLRQAQLHLGRRQVRLWLLLLVYLGAEGGDPVDNPLVQMAAVRAKTMECLARRLGCSGERAFLAGMVSLFDVAVGLPMDDIVGRLSLDAEIARALLAGEGALGSLLRLARATEADDGPGVSRALAELPGLAPEHLLEATDAALRWAGAMA